MTDWMLIALYSLQALVHLVLCVALVLKCFENKLRVSKRTSVLIASVFIIISVAIIELFLERTSPFPEYGKYVGFLWALLAILFALITIKTNVLNLLFLVFFLMNAGLKTTFTAKSIYELHILPQNEVSYILISIGVLCIIASFMWYIVVKLFKKVIEIDASSNVLKWLLVLPAAYFVIYLGLGSEGYLRKGVYGLVLIIISSLASFLVYVAIAQVLIKTHESTAATAKAQIAEKLIVMQKEQYKRIAVDIENTARIEHDFRHNLIVIKDLLDRKNLDGLNKYLEEYADATMPKEITSVCNNHLVDVVLKHYVSRAKAEGVKINVSVVFPNEFVIPDNELVVLYGNLLENALESCTRQNSENKFIEVQTKILSKSMLATVMRNSFDHEILKKDKLFLSSKHGGEGVGVSTVRYICEKNGGSCEFSFESGVFTSRILLMG